MAGSAGSLLLGAGVSMASAGIRFGLDSRLDSPMAPHVKAEDALPVAIVITLAAGALIPRWIVRRLRASGFKPSQLDRAAGSKGSLIDAESGWMVVATVAVICGVAASMLPVLLSLASHWASWMFVRFVLSDVFLRLFQMLLLTALCSFPFVAMGLTAASLFKLVSKTAASSAHSWVSLLAGLIVGVGFVLALQSRSFLLLPASSLPVLMLAILACDLWGRCAKAGRFDPAVQFAEARDR